MIRQRIPRAQKSGRLMCSQTLSPPGRRARMVRSPTFLLVMYFLPPVHQSPLRPRSHHHHRQTHILTLQRMTSSRPTICPRPCRMPRRLPRTLLLGTFSLTLSLPSMSHPQGWATSGPRMPLTFLPLMSSQHQTVLLLAIAPRQILTLRLGTSSRCRITPFRLEMSSQSWVSLTYRLLCFSEPLQRSHRLAASWTQLVPAGRPSPPLISGPSRPPG